MLNARKPWLVPLCLFIYTTGMFIWLLPDNHDTSLTEKVITVVAAYAIIGVLYYVLHKKQQMAQERENDLKKNNH